MESKEPAGVMPGRRAWNLAALGGSIAVALVISESAVRILTPFPITEWSNKISHDTLFYLLDPALADVNERGFRGPQEQSEYDIVTIGDSHTYGNNVPWQQSWPYELGRQSNMTVNNLAIGSYGVYQYAYLFEMALSYAPSHVIVGLYPANDLQPWTACQLLRRESWRNRVERDSLETDFCTQTWAADDTTFRKPFVLLDEIALFSLIKHVLWRRVFPGGVYEFERDGYHVQVPRGLNYDHLRTTNLEIADVRSSYRNSLRLFRRMSEIADRHEVELAILVIPSSTRVVDNWARRHGMPIPGEMAAAASSESRLTARYVEFFEALHVPLEDLMVELTDLLDEASRSGVTVYPEGDGHPLANGYRVYAEVAKMLLEKSHRDEGSPPEMVSR